MKLLSTIALAALLPVQAFAQDYDDYDDAYDEDRSSEEEVRPQREEVVREVVKGFFAKANVGTAIYLGQFSANSEYGRATKAGTATTIGVGGDFVDQERFSMAWEVSFMQGIHNGLEYTYQAGQCGALPCHQGDFRTYTFMANLESSWYPSRRLGIGGRVGAGVLISPLLIESSYYQTQVVPKFGGDPGWHSGAKPVFAAGPTLEYYSKLSHFSVGIDADVFFGIGWDLGVNATGYFKYTF